LVLVLVISLLATVLPRFAQSARAEAPPSRAFTMVQAGPDFVYATRADGTVWAWGENCSGQLGNRFRSSVAAPMRVLAPESMTLAAGGSGVLGLKADGTVWKWGTGCYSFDPAVLSPRQVSGIDNVVAVSRDYLALKSDGTVWSWGSNEYSRLGDSNYYRPTPAPIAELTGIKAIQAGNYGALALTQAGTVWQWGTVGGAVIKPTPVAGLSDVKAVAQHSFAAYALRTDGTVWAWGENYYGQLGDGTTVNRSVPAAVPGLTDVAMIAAGDDFVLALKSDGTVWAWGANFSGQLGTAKGGKALSPTAVPGLSGVTAISAGTSFAVALKADGTIWTWGSNYAGQLGDGTVQERTGPGQVALPESDDLVPPTWPEGSKLTRAAGTLTSATIAWGPAEDNVGVIGYRIYRDGQLVDGLAGDTRQLQVNGLQPGTAYSFRVEAVDRFGNVSAPGLTTTFRTIRRPALAAGWYHSLLRLPDLRAVSWGANDHGQLGLGYKGATGQTVPIPIPGLKSVDTVSAGDAHSVALTSGHMYAWGANSQGQLGTGGYGDYSTPVDGYVYPKAVFAGTRYTLIATDSYVEKTALGPSGAAWQWFSVWPAVMTAGGSGHFLALKADGTVWAWGSNARGQLGDGTTTDRDAPVQVPNLTDVVEIAAGEDFSVALKTDGTVWTWGDNFYGQLGAVTAGTYQTSPIQVAGLTDAVTIAAGQRHTLATTAQGAVWTWGNNQDGQLGDGTQTKRTTAAPVAGLTDAVEAAGGYGHSLVLTASGAVWAWGANTYGQLGDGTYQRRLTPVRTVSTWEDTEAPTWPADKSLTVQGPTSIGVTLSWTTASDDIYVKGYQVFVNGQKSLEFVAPTLQATINGLQAGLTYSFQVQAVDANGNVSLDGPTAMAATLPPPANQQAIGHAVGSSFSLALRSDHTVWAWGYMGTGLGAGDGVDVARSSPVRVRGLSGITAVAAGDSHALALGSDGTVWAWGNNYTGELGDGTLTRRLSPRPVAGLPRGITAIAAHAGSSWALDSQGRVWAWGDISNTRMPVQVQGLPIITAIAGGAGHALFLTSDHTVWAVGQNNYGQLGGVLSGYTNVPVQVAGLSDVQAIAAGDFHSLALRTDGTVWAWGYNGQGQLGDGSTTDRHQPVQVAELTSVTSIAGGWDHSLAVKADGTVWAWGRNLTSSGSIFPGYGSQTPVQAVNLFGPGTVSTAQNHAMVLNQAGVLISFGDNTYGQLGRGNAQGYGGPSPLLLPVPDRTAPTWNGYGAINTSFVTEHSMRISWTGALDDQRVTTYRVYKNELLLKAIPATNQVGQPNAEYDVSGLDAGTYYLFKVVALDAEGNQSTVLSLTTQTSGVDTVKPTLAHDDEGAPLILLEVRRGNTWDMYGPIDYSDTLITFRQVAGDEFRLWGWASEPIQAVAVNGQVTATSSLGFDVPITMPAAGAASFRLELTDFSNNKGILPTVQFRAGLTVTLSQPAAAHVTVGRSRSVKLTGTTSEEPAMLLVVDGADPTIRYRAEIVISGTTFTATVTLPPGDEDATYQLWVVGVGKDGFITSPDAQGRDQRTVTVDVTPPGQPIITSPSGVGDTIKVNTRTVTIRGTAEPGAVVQAALAGTTKPLSATADQTGAFTFANVVIVEGANTLTLTAIDKVKNQSDPLVVTIIRDTAAPAVTALTLTAKRDGDAEELSPTVLGSTYAYVTRAATEFKLTAAFSENITAVTVGGSSSGVQLTEQGFSYILPVLQPMNSFDLAITDGAGNVRSLRVTVALNSGAPAITVTTPAAGIFVGADPAGRTTRSIDFAGTSSKKLQSLRVLDAETGEEVNASVTVNTTNPTKWTARVTVPITDPATRTFRFEGTDAAGNVSAADPTGKDTRTVTVDPFAPVVALCRSGEAVVFTQARQLSICGTALDTGSGLKKVMIGTAALAPAIGQEKAEFAFSRAFTLTEGTLSTFTVYAEDLAGNRSPATTIRALLKTALKTPTVFATWAGTDKTLRIVGATDKAVLVDGTYVAIVPLEITVTDQQGATVRTFMLDARNLTGYDPGKGTFALTAGDLAPGTYTVTVRATAPVEFPGLPAKTVSVKVSVPSH
jgi:alpha-tubulin suppressor-like RCC1 family protein